MKNITNKSNGIPRGASIESHRHAWDYIANQYTGGTALPAWGPRGELKDENILGTIAGKNILEIGFGSGDSLIYLLTQGAAHVTGIDFSSSQFKIAEERITAACGKIVTYVKKVTLLLRSMDEDLPPGPYDAVVAIYSVGWSEQPEKLFTKIYHTLKPGGYFYFSWDHYLSRIVEHTEHGLTVVKNYHDPMPLVREDWKGSGSLIETHQLRPSDWFQMLTTAGFMVDGFWEPKADKNLRAPKIYSTTYSTTISDKVPTCVVFRARKL